MKSKNQEIIDVFNSRYACKKFDKNRKRYSKLKQKLINSQEIWIKYSDEEMRNYGMYRNWYNLCVREKSETREQINLIQQRILELTNEYKKYLD